MRIYIHGHYISGSEFVWPISTLISALPVEFSDRALPRSNPACLIYGHLCLT